MLTPAQKTTLKNHLLANTNVIQAFVAGQGEVLQSLAINAVADVGDNGQRIADWYNRTATAVDSQPITNLRVWNPGVTMRQHNSAIDYSIDPLGAIDSIQTNNWLRYQVLIWAGQSNLDAPAYDCTDPQVRAGIIKVWGDTPAGNAKNLGGLGGGLGCGQKVGSTFELVLSSVPGGSSPGAAYTNARTVQKDAGGALLYGQLVSASTLVDSKTNG